MSIPLLNPRRPLDDDNRTGGYLESDKDFVLNNIELAVHLLETHGVRVMSARQSVFDLTGRLCCVCNKPATRYMGGSHPYLCDDADCIPF